MILRTCNKCKHLIGVRDRIERANLWECGNPKNVQEELVNLVTGIPYKILIVPYCKDQRYNKDKIPETVCGPEGTWFEEYEEHKFDPTIGGLLPVELEVFDGATLTANRKKAEERIAKIQAKKLSKDDLSNL